tara:strand:- start:5 stop:655 length:651 start_codon:yes stop_codon:yes gene_type:complete
MSDDDTNEENPLRKMIGEENFFAMPEADRLWMGNVLSRIEHEASLHEDEEEEESGGAEFDLEGNLTGGTPMPKGVRKVLRKILGATEEEDRNPGQIAASTAYNLSTAQFAGSRTAASYVIDQMEEDGDLRTREAVSAYVMFDEMLAVRFLEQSVYNHASAEAAGTPCGMKDISIAEFKEMVQGQQKKVMKRLLAAASKAVVASFENRFEAMSEGEV